MLGRFGRKAVFGLLNHLLRQETWARERLRPFSGAHALITGGGVELTLLIDDQGLFEAGDPRRLADVTITLPADMAVRLLIDRESLFSALKLSGAADLAETLGFVFRNLRWDAEGDLAGLIGDIPARRLARGRDSLRNALRQGANRLVANLVEYATEDSEILPSGEEIDAYAKGVEQVRERLARLEQRVARL